MPYPIIISSVKSCENKDKKKWFVKELLVKEAFAIKALKERTVKVEENVEESHRRLFF